MKSCCFRTVKNHCKASKIHSSGDVCPGHKKGKVRKTDGRKLGESSPQDADEPYVGSYAALPTSPSLKGEGEVGNSRMEICRNQAYSDKNENPCKWRECAICGGFWDTPFLA